MSNDHTKLLQEVNESRKDSLFELLDITFTELKPERAVATMPVDARTHQRFGILHGGASAALAESVGSVAGWLHVDRSKQSVVGVEINANHLRSVKSGLLTAVATPAKVGRTLQVWNVNITDDKDRLICVSRLTLAVVSKLR